MKQFSRNFHTRASRAYMLVLLALACASLGGYLCGCSKDESDEKISSEPAVENPQAKPYGRMLDQTYTNALWSFVREQKSLRGKKLKLDTEYEELEKLDPASPRLAEIEAEMKALAKRQQLHTLKAEMVIRDRIAKEQADIKAARLAKTGTGARKSGQAATAPESAAAVKNNAKKGN